MTKAANVTCFILPCFFANQTWTSSLFQFTIWIVFSCIYNVLSRSWRSTYRKANFKTLSRKHNVLKFNEKWKDGLLLSAKDGKMFCPYRKEFNKSRRNKFISGCESIRIENVCLHEANKAHKTGHSAFLKWYVSWMLVETGEIIVSLSLYTRALSSYWGTKSYNLFFYRNL